MPSSTPGRMCGHSQNKQMSPNHLRTSWRPDNISWDSWVTWHCHLCHRFQMVIPHNHLWPLDSDDCIIMVPSTHSFLTVGPKNNLASHTFQTVEKYTRFQPFLCTGLPFSAARMKYLWGIGCFLTSGDDILKRDVSASACTNIEGWLVIYSWIIHYFSHTIVT